MNILHVTPVFYPAHGDGGPVIAFYELCASLSQIGCDVRVLTTDAHGWNTSLDVDTEQEIKLDKFRVRYCRRVMRRSVAPRLLQLLPSYIQWADVVHLSSAYNFPTIPALGLSKIFRKPLIWTPHGALQRWRGSRRKMVKNIWENTCRLVIPKWSVLHATSEEEAKASQARFPDTELVVIPYPIEIPEQVKHVEGNSVLRLLYLGRLDPKKGIENLMMACKLLREQTDLSWFLTIAGAGDQNYENDLQARIRELELTGQVKMVGHVVGHTKDYFFQNADMLIVPSYTENFGMVVAEALVRQVPVIASMGTPWRTVQEKGCGLWVNNDPESLAKAIEQMSRLPLREMGMRGREWVRCDFSSEKVAQKMLACYARLRTHTTLVSKR